MSLHLPTPIQKYIDLVRRLESSDYIFDNDPALVDKDLKNNVEGTFANKLILRTDALDPTHKLLQIITRTHFIIKSFGRAWAVVSFFVGFVGVIGLLNIPVLNFFYVLMALLGWHTLTLVLWLMRIRWQERSLLLDTVLERLKPKDAVQRHAFEIHLESINPVQKWYVASLMHRAWLCGLAGSLLALFLMFLFKSYAFMWESTLLTQSHFVMLIKGFAFIPSLFGFHLPTASELNMGGGANKLAILMMLCVILYAFVPRLVAFVYCQMRAKNDFRIDTNLYYYQNLHRKIMSKVVNANDFTPPYLKKINPIKPTSQQKIAALLERDYKDVGDTAWQSFLSQPHVHNLGVIDTQADVQKLANAVEQYKAQICLGILSHVLPDRGLLKKLDTLRSLASYGISVQLLDDVWAENDHSDQWKTALAERGINEVKFNKD